MSYDGYDMVGQDEEEERDPIFGDFEDDFLKFDKVCPRYSNRPDLHAFVLLDKLCPGTEDIISDGEHDQIFLNIDVEELKKFASKENLLELHRCGVFYEEGLDSLSMFV